MKTVHIARALLLARAWGQRMSPDPEPGDEYHDARRVEALRGIDTTRASTFAEALEFVVANPGWARRVVAEIVGRDYEHAVDVSAFGHGWREQRRIGVFASARAERAYYARWKVT